MALDSSLVRHRFLTKKQHVAGTEEEWALAEWVAEAWRAQGWDEVQLVPYEVLLSYPKKDTPNLVRYALLTFFHLVVHLSRDK